MPSTLNDIIEAFSKNIVSVKQLLKLDDFIQEVCLNAFRKIELFYSNHKVNNPQFKIDPEVKTLSDIRKHQSLRPHYEIMYNQCVVLLVSYFTSSMEDVFEIGFNTRFQEKTLIGTEQDIKFKLDELQDIGQDMANRIGEIVIAKKEISFQDMQSIARTSKDYFGFEPKREDIDVNNIILSQACRHCIVHNGGVFSEKGAKQISSATPRGIKQGLQKGDRIQFEPSEIEIIASSMLCYIDKFIIGLVPKNVANIKKG
jgi:hypothetical protein